MLYFLNDCLSRDQFAHGIIDLMAINGIGIIYVKLLDMNLFFRRKGIYVLHQIIEFKFVSTRN